MDYDWFNRNAVPGNPFEVCAVKDFCNKTALDPVSQACVHVGMPYRSVRQEDGKALIVAYPYFGMAASGSVYVSLEKMMCAYTYRVAPTLIFFCHRTCIRIGVLRVDFSRQRRFIVGILGRFLQICSAWLMPSFTVEPCLYSVPLCVLAFLALQINQQQIHLSNLVWCLSSVSD